MYISIIFDKGKKTFSHRVLLSKNSSYDLNFKVTLESPNVRSECEHIIYNSMCSVQTEEGFSLDEYGSVWILLKKVYYSSENSDNK